MNITRKRKLRNVEIEFKLDSTSYKCTKKYKATSSAMSRHMACKLEGRVKNIGVKNPLRAAIEDSSSLKKKGSKSMGVTDKIIPKASKLPVPIGNRIRKPKDNSTDRLINFKGLSLAEVQVTKIDACVCTEITEAPAALGNASASVGSTIRKPEANSTERLLNFKGLSPMEVQATKIDASIGTEIMESPDNASASASVGIEITKVTATLVDSPVHTETVFKFVKENTDLYPMHISLEDENTFNFYKNKLAMFRGTDMRETVREISRNFISDEVLKDYSYLGRRKKMRFKDFDNLTRVIVASTIESIRRVYRDKCGKEKEESVDEKQKLYDEVHDYFANEYIKKAPSRL